MEFFNEPIRDLIAKNVDIDKNFKYEQFKVGRSNITFKVFDKENTYVLRRPPYGDKLESAHNMSREYKIIDVLSKNNIKVPKPIFLYKDKKVCDDDFYVMEYIKGETIATNIEAEKYSKDDKEKISESFIETISTIHNFDVINSKELDLATKLLFENIPKQQRVCIVHGDYRLDNVRVNNGSVAAVLDWELCTIGDPLADLGTIIASWSNPEEEETPFIYSPSLAGGFSSRNELIKLYENKTDLSINDIEFYTRLSYWKHAMIMEGVYVRYSHGSYGKVDEKEIELFKQSTLMFAKKAANKNLIKEIT